jgi:hypothetical protein
MLSREKCIEAFFLSGRREAGWYRLHGRKARARGLEARDGAIWSGSKKICEALEEPPQGYRVFGQRPVYYQVFPDAPKKDLRVLRKVMEMYGFDWILGFKDFSHPPLFGRPSDIWLPLKVETSYGVAENLGKVLFWVKNLEGLRVFVRWKPLREKPFHYIGPERITGSITWKVEFESERPLPEEELLALYRQKERRMQETAEILAEISEKALALGMGRELREGKGLFPEGPGKLGKLRKLRKEVRKVLERDEELVRHLLERKV